MKKILVPIDYSYDSFQGLDYAMQLAKIFKSSLVLFHVLSPSTLNKVLKITNKQDQLIVSQNILTELANQKISQHYISIPYQIKVREGEVIDTILDEAASGEYQLIIMGTRDKHSILDKWIGTVSIGVSQKCSIPLLLIPHGSSFKAYARFLIATDYHINKKGVLDFISNWNKPFNAFVKFLHIKTSETDTFHEESSQILNKYYQQKHVRFSFEIELKEGIDIPAIIYKTAIQENMDLIVLTTEKRSGLASILLKSVSHEIVIRSVKPVLLLHPDGETIAPEPKLDDVYQKLL